VLGRPVGAQAGKSGSSHSICRAEDVGHAQPGAERGVIPTSLPAPTGGEGYFRLFARGGSRQVSLVWVDRKAHAYSTEGSRRQGEVRLGEFLSPPEPVAQTAGFAVCGSSSTRATRLHGTTRGMEGTRTVRTAVRATSWPPEETHGEKERKGRRSPVPDGTGRSFDPSADRIRHAGDNRYGKDADRKIGGPRYPVGSGLTRISFLPKFSPFSSPISSRGAFSKPSVMSSRYLTRPARSQPLMSEMKSGICEA